MPASPVLLFCPAISVITAIGGEVLVFLCVPLCSAWLTVLGFSDHARCRRSPGASGDFATLCLRPSAIDPTPLTLLLKTKVKVQFDKTVIRLSKALFRVLSRSNPTQFQPGFSIFAVRSAEGRKACTVYAARGLADLPVAIC
jgi:hypothetical protein